MDGAGVIGSRHGSWHDGGRRQEVGSEAPTPPLQAPLDFRTCPSAGRARSAAGLSLARPRWGPYVSADDHCARAFDDDRPTAFAVRRRARPFDAATAPRSAFPRPRAGRQPLDSDIGDGIGRCRRPTTAVRRPDTPADRADQRGRRQVRVRIANTSAPSAGDRPSTHRTHAADASVRPHGRSLTFGGNRPSPYRPERCVSAIQYASASRSDRIHGQHLHARQDRQSTTRVTALQTSYVSSAGDFTASDDPDVSTITDWPFLTRIDVAAGPRGPRLSRSATP